MAHLDTWKTPSCKKSQKQRRSRRSSQSYPERPQNGDGDTSRQAPRYAYAREYCCPFRACSDWFWEKSGWASSTTSHLSRITSGEKVRPSGFHEKTRMSQYPKRTQNLLETLERDGWEFRSPVCSYRALILLCSLILSSAQTLYANPIHHRIKNFPSPV